MWQPKNILITGAAGFIGFHLSRKLLDQGCTIAGLDNLNDYYDPALKQARLDLLTPNPSFTHVNIDLADRSEMENLFSKWRFDAVVNLAAQAGVRYSLKNPHSYVNTNLVGFLNVLEGCRHSNVQHLVFASSSSVYGANTNMPFSVHDNVDHPVSLYAASKKSNELMAHSYSSLFGLHCTGLRFFTVYGPWGRPDMALFLFTKAILEDRPIDIFNNGNMKRDFTYIDDIVEGISRVIHKLPESDPSWNGNEPDSATSYCPYRLYNIGNNTPVELMHYIETIEKYVGIRAKKNFLPMQKGDVSATCANVDDLEKAVGFRPNISIETGIRNFVEWYRGFYKV